MGSQNKKIPSLCRLCLLIASNVLTLNINALRDAVSTATGITCILSAFHFSGISVCSFDITLLLGLQ